MVNMDAGCRAKWRNLLGVVLCAITLFLAPGPILAGSPGEITVSAAASLKNAFEEMGKGFAGKHPGMKVRFNIAGSGDLQRQIEAGAPVDVFASAAAREMDALEQKGLILPGTRHNFIGNALALIQPAAGMVIGSFADLTRADVQRIAIGNPERVPAGMYARETLQYLKLWEAIKDRLIFGESVRQVLDYVTRGEVDAGMVFSSDAIVGGKGIRVIQTAPQGSHRAIVYPIAVVRGTKSEEAAKGFVQFVLTEEGQAILRKYGFQPLSASR
jgi:molybdate transport system substrate-binding protein